MLTRILKFLEEGIFRNISHGSATTREEQKMNFETKRETF